MLFDAEKPEVPTAMSGEGLAALRRRLKDPAWSHVEAVTREAGRREVLARLVRMLIGGSP